MKQLLDEATKKRNKAKKRPYLNLFYEHWRVANTHQMTIQQRMTLLIMLRIAGYEIASGTTDAHDPTWPLLGTDLHHYDPRMVTEFKVIPGPKYRCRIVGWEYLMDCLKQYIEKHAKKDEK